MSNAEFGGAEELDLGMCAINCPNILKCMAERAADIATNDERMQAAFDPELDTNAEELLNEARQAQGTGGLPSQLEVWERNEGPITTGAEYAHRRRKSLGAFAQIYEARIQHQTEHMRALAKDCAGPLVVESTVVDRTISVVVCASPELPEGSTTEELTVTRTQK